MGVFNWNAGEGESVLTVYFWLYVGLAGGLTLLTVVTWLLLTTRKGKVEDNSDHISMSLTC